MRAASYGVSWSMPLTERRRFMREWMEREDIPLHSEAVELLSWCCAIQVRDLSSERAGWYWRDFLEFSTVDLEDAVEYVHHTRAALDDSVQEFGYKILAKGRFFPVFDYNDGDMIIVSTVAGDETVYDMQHGDLPEPLFRSVGELARFLAQAYRIGYSTLMCEAPGGMFFFRPLREFAAQHNPSIAFWREDHPLIWDWPQGSTNRPVQ